MYHEVLSRHVFFACLFCCVIDIFICTHTCIYMRNGGLFLDAIPCIHSHMYVCIKHPLMPYAQDIHTYIHPHICIHTLVYIHRYIVIADHEYKTLVLAIRGTFHAQDALTDLRCSVCYLQGCTCVCVCVCAFMHVCMPRCVPSTRKTH